MIVNFVEHFLKMLCIIYLLFNVAGVNVAGVNLHAPQLLLGMGYIFLENISLIF